MIKNPLIKAMDTLKQYEMIFKLLLVYMLSLLLTKISLFLLGQRVQFSDIVFLFLFILWLKELKLPQDTGLNKPFLIFITFCLLSFLHSSNLFVSAMELLGIIYLFIMLILVVNIIDTKRKLDTVIKFWIGSLVVLLVLGFIGLCMSMITGKGNAFCWVFDRNLPYINKTVFRMCSIFHNPLALANYLIISLGFVISDLMLTKNSRYKIFLRIMIFFMFLAILFTVSREILGFMISSFLIYNYFHKVKNLKFKIIRFVSISLLIIIFLLVIIFCSSFHVSSYKIENFPTKTHRELVININYAYSEKLALKVAALEMLKRHPFLGVGLKMFPFYAKRLNNENFFHSKNLIPIHYYIYDKTKEYSNYLLVDDPHNDILQYFAETGILGGGAFIFFIVTFLYLIYSNLKKRSDNRYFEVRLFCFFASFIGVLIEGIDLDVFKVRPVWFLMALTLALIMISKGNLLMNYESKS